jgi:hypothetical protein
MRSARKATVAALAAGMLVLTAGAAVAAPSNDTYAGRTVIAAVPFAETVDTSTATTDGDDVDINATCGAPATDASVWYEYTAPADGAIVVDVSGSDYSGGVLIATGGPGAWTVQACGPFAVAAGTSAGETYTIHVFDFQGDGGGNGGTLRIEVNPAPAPPSIDVTVNPIGQLDPRTGGATISGTVTCTGEALFAFVETELRQQVGRFTIIGGGGLDILCDGATHNWSVEVFSEVGKYSGGKAASVTLGVACGEVLCGLDFEERQVHLRR